MHSIESDGTIVLRRGASAAPYVDQFNLPKDDGGLPERKATRGFAYTRDAAVRERVLKRAMGICELCNEPGFQLKNGSVYLETHHVVPLVEEGRDVDSNVAAICPNDHREAHFGKQASEIRARLLAIVGSKLSSS